MTTILAGVSWCKNCSHVETLFSSIEWWEGVSLKNIHISCIVPSQSSGFPEMTYSCLVSWWYVFPKLGDWGRHNQRPLFKGWCSEWSGIHHSPGSPTVLDTLSLKKSPLGAQGVCSFEMRTKPARSLCTTPYANWHSFWGGRTFQKYVSCLLSLTSNSRC